MDYGASIDNKPFSISSGKDFMLKILRAIAWANDDPDQRRIYAEPGLLVSYIMNLLTHWSRVTHICVSKLTIIGSDNGLSPDWRQAIILTNTGLLLIGPLGTNFSEILIKILTFSFKKMRLKVSSAKRRSFCLGLNVLMRRPFFLHSWVHYSS